MRCSEGALCPSVLRTAQKRHPFPAPIRRQDKGQSLLEAIQQKGGPLHCTDAPHLISPALTAFFPGSRGKRARIFLAVLISACSWKPQSRQVKRCRRRFPRCSQREQIWLVEAGFTSIACSPHSCARCSAQRLLCPASDRSAPAATAPAGARAARPRTCSFRGGGTWSCSKTSTACGGAQSTSRLATVWANV
jgi:hypothetical protein